MPMRIEKEGSWLRPALLAPYLSMTTFVTAVVAVQFVFYEPNPKFGPLASWVLGMQAGSIASGLISLALIAVDLVCVKRGTIHIPIIHDPIDYCRIRWLGDTCSLQCGSGQYLFT